MAASIATEAKIGNRKRNKQKEAISNIQNNDLLKITIKEKNKSKVRRAHAHKTLPLIMRYSEGLRFIKNLP